MLPRSLISVISVGSQITFVDYEDYAYLNKFKWHLNTRGYVTRNDRANKGHRKNKLVRMHREILGFPLDKSVDHANHDKLDNRRANLRACSVAENVANRRKFLERGNLSIYKGVSFDARPKRSKRWRAYITKDDCFISLGYHHTEAAAALAYNSAAIKLFGEFAHVNSVR